MATTETTETAAQGEGQVLTIEQVTAMRAEAAAKEAAEKEPQFPIAESAEDILAVEDQEIIPVPVPEWKLTVHIKRISANEAIKVTEISAGSPEMRKAAIVNFCAMCLCKPNGDMMFTSQEQVLKLREKSIAAFARIQEIALKHNGFSQQMARILGNV